MIARLVFRSGFTLVLAGAFLAIALQAMSSPTGAKSIRGAGPQLASGTDYTVGGPCGSTIQACISNPIVVAGDRILIPAGDYTESLVLNKGVSLIGENVNTTVIHAVSDERALFITGNTITASTTISGLTLAGGNLLNTPGFICPPGCGGGVLITNTAQPLLQNSIISNNAAPAGGGLYVHAGSPITLLNMTFISNAGGGGLSFSPLTVIGGQFVDNNYAGGFGGGLNVSNTLILSDTAFLRNAAGVGGGVFARSAVTVTNSHFEGNRSFTSPGGGGGGLYTLGTATVTNTSFISNSTLVEGGGVRAMAGAVINGGRFERNYAQGRGGGVSTESRLTINGTDFISNTAGHLLFGGGSGAGVHSSFGLTLTGGIFFNNRPGALEVFGNLFITGTRFISNSTPGYGGAISHPWVDFTPSNNGRIVNAFFAQNHSDLGGGSLYLASGGNVVVLHTTIADSGLNPSQAIVVVSGTVGITDTIIASHTVGISQTDGTVYADYNLFFGNTLTQTGVIADGGHSLSGDPAFANPAIDDYHIMSTSLAIDTGTNVGVTTDIDGDVRPFGGGFDIGADEFVGPRVSIFLPLVMKSP